MWDFAIWVMFFAFALPFFMLCLLVVFADALEDITGISIRELLRRKR